MASPQVARGIPIQAAALPVAAIVVGGVLVARLAGVADVAPAQTFTIIFTAIVVEALPFVLLGAFASAMIEVFVSDRALERITRLPVGLQLPAATLGGFVFPVCECGSVPVARRLMGRGMHPAAGVAFMLASPVFNPIVLIATWVAYSPRGLGLEMVLGRAGLGFLLAVVVGWALGAEGVARILRARDESRSNGTEESCHDHPASRGRSAAFLDHLTHDFLFMGKFLVAGAALSAGFQTLLPQSLVSGVARTAVIGTLALMAIAFLSSLCSEADAFVAVSFSQFPLGSQLAFLVFGPVLDLKLTFLYSAAFHRRFVVNLALVAVPVVVAGSLMFQVLVG